MQTVHIIMGSQSDLPVMMAAADFIKDQGIAFEISVISAHRNLDGLRLYLKEEVWDEDIIIAGAGGAAHLPGVIAGMVLNPVIGVPIKSSNSIDGWDSILSILQMPSGVPVATVALNGAKNAGILALQIIALHDPIIREKLNNFKRGMKAISKVNKDNYEEVVRWT